MELQNILYLQVFFSVFVLPIFEVAKKKTIPNNKSELLKMMKSKDANWFHQKVCPTCHKIPNATEWLLDKNVDKLSVAFTAKRTGKYHHWEPFYIGTNAEPLFDERLSWEGKSNKMTQCYILCVLNYNFNILSNTFLGSYALLL